METDYLIQSIGVAIGLGGAVSGIIALLSYRKQEKLRREAPTLEDRIATLIEQLKMSSSAISEIEAEIERRREIAERLKGDVQRYEQLRELSQSQVEAIAQTIRGEIAVESRKSIWRNAIITFIVALLFFFLGWWLSGL